MRIAATVIVIAIAATSAGCGGSSSSSSHAPAQTAQATVAPTAATAAATTTTSGRGRVAKTVSSGGHRAKTVSGSGYRAKTGPTHLVGRPVDVAESMLKGAGISYKLIPLHGHANDVGPHWGVCETQPAAGSSEGSPGVDLMVAHLRCGAR